MANEGCERGKPGHFSPVILIGVVFYLLIMRPARNRQRKQAELMSTLMPGPRS